MGILLNRGTLCSLSFSPLSLSLSLSQPIFLIYVSLWGPIVLFLSQVPHIENFYNVFPVQFNTKFDLRARVVSLYCVGGFFEIGAQNCTTQEGAVKYYFYCGRDFGERVLDL